MDKVTSLSRREFLATLGIGLAMACLTAVVAVLTGRRQKASRPSSPPDRLRRLVAFHLVDRSGRHVSEADLAGKILVVNFVFTSCSLSCRAVNERMEEIQRRFINASDVQLVSLTVDPRTDTPPVLAKFAASFHADTNRWLFLTGGKSELYRLIEASFIPRSPELETLIPGGFADTARIMLVDPHGNVCGSFNGLNPSVSGSIVSEVERIRQLNKSQ